MDGSSFCFVCVCVCVCVFVPNSIQIIVYKNYPKMGKMNKKCVFKH